MTTSPFKKQGERANDLMDLIHTNVCEPLSTYAGGGYSYFMTFTDDLSVSVSPSPNSLYLDI